MSQNIDLDTTLSALERGLQSIPTDEALAIIETWYSQFKNTPLGENLRQVREAIESSNLAGVPLPDILIDLGANTAAASSEVGDDEVTATKIQDIATVLSEAGNALK